MSMDRHHVYVFHHHHHHYQKPQHQTSKMEHKEKLNNTGNQSALRAKADLECTKMCCELESDQGLFLEYDEEENDEEENDLALLMAASEDAVEALHFQDELEIEEKIDEHFLYDCVITAPPTSQVDSAESEDDWAGQMELCKDDLISSPVDNLLAENNDNAITEDIKDLSILLKSFYQVVGVSDVSKFCASESYSSSVGGCAGSGHRDLKLHFGVQPTTTDPGSNDDTDIGWKNKRMENKSELKNVVTSSENRPQSVKPLVQNNLRTSILPQVSLPNSISPKGYLSRLEHAWSSDTAIKNGANLALFSLRDSSWLRRRVRHRERRDMAMQMVAEWLHKEPLWSTDEEIWCSTNELAAPKRPSENLPEHHNNVLAHEYRNIHEHHHHYHYHHYHHL